MSPAQVCALLVAVLAGGLGAPLARSAPAAAATPLRSAWLDDQGPFGQRRNSAASADTPADYDYYLYEYDYYDYGQAAAEPAVDSAEAQTQAPAERQVARVAGEAEKAGAVSSDTVDSAGAGEKQSSTGVESASQAVTARPGVPAMDLSVVSRHHTSRRKPKIPPTVSTQTLLRSTKRSDEFKRAKTAARPRTTSVPSHTTPAPGPTTAQPLTTTLQPETAGTTATSTTAAPSPTRANRQRAGSSDGAASTESASPAADAASRRSAVPHAADERSNHVATEQEASGSSRVLTYHVQHTQHSRVAKSPRDSPDFFVPPIRRRPSRRRVPLSAQNQQASGRSLGAQLAQQVRRQLAQLQTQQADTLAETSGGPASSAAPPSSTERPYQHPFIPSSPTTTSEPYKHPFIPSSPTTTSEPYKHPFIPSPPTTTSEPYVHPFIPSSPTTTSEPYQHPFIPSSPTTTSEPYQHPHIPVPPESTRRPPVPPSTSTPPPPPPPPSQEPPSAPEEPLPRRVPAGSDSAVPRLHLPRRPAAPAPEPVTTTTPAPAPAAAAATATATIVHEQTLEAGFIVGEYGELGGGGTVRGVKYAADSSVDRGLLEAALQQFLRL